MLESQDAGVLRIVSGCKNKSSDSDELRKIIFYSFSNSLRDKDSYMIFGLAVSALLTSEVMPELKII